MKDDLWTDPRKLAAVVYDIGVAVDPLLLVFARDLAADGVRVGGIVPVPRSAPGCGPKSPMQLQDIATGEEFSICEDLGRGPQDCRLDPALLRQAAARIRAAIESSADLIFVPHFGKEEARGDGFREELALAVRSGRPILAAIPRGMTDNWLAFTDGVGTLLDARLWVLKHWWKEIGGATGASSKVVHSLDALADTRSVVSTGEATRQSANDVCRSGATAGAMQVGESVRWVQATPDLELPAVPFPSRRIYFGAGEACLRNLVRKHHEKLRHSSIGKMFPEADAPFEALVAKVGDYVVEACGGPAQFTPNRGETCMRIRHFPFAIDEQARETWLMCLWRAMEDVDFPAGLRREFWDWMEPLSARMINRRTMRAQPPRFPFHVMVVRMNAS